MNKKARIITASTLAGLLAITLYSSYEHEYIPVCGIYSEDYLPFGKYSNGDIYIGDEEYINSIKDNIGENDILIVMGQQDGDPNACIISSHEITNKDERYEILTILKMYEYKYPSDWDRSLESMRVEWSVHNIFYNLGIERNRTQDVDLDNSEEKIYSSKILQRLIK